MKSNELRLGNLVTDEWYESFKNIITVTDINKNGIDLFVEDDGKWAEIAQTWVGCEMPFENLRGIPLTDDILPKLGFHFNDETFGYCSKNHMLVISNTDDDMIFMPFCTNDDDCYIKIKYVHQLQNICFVFGEELTIQG